MATILFLSAETMGDALGAIGRSFQPLFAEFGHDLLEINFAKPGAVEQLNASLQRGNISFAFAFVGMGADMKGTTSSGAVLNLWDHYGIPFISLYGDTPAYFFDRHVMPTQFCASMYAFPEHARFRRQLPAIQGLIGTSPPGVMESIPKGSIDFKTKEQGRLLFLKNGNDPDQLVSEWRQALPSAIFLMMMDVADELVRKMPESNGNDIDQQVCRYFDARGLDVSNAVRLRLFFVAQLDDYLRRVKSNLMARVLMDFPIDMYGHNWGHMDFSRKRIRFTPGGDYTQSAALIKNALGMLDMSPNTSLAPHERPLRAFGSYTLCLTNEQEFFTANVRHADEFSFTFDADSLRNLITEVIGNPKRFVELGVQVSEAFRQTFPASRFAELLIEIADVLRFVQRGRPGTLQPYFAWPPQSI